MSRKDKAKAGEREAFAERLRRFYAGELVGRISQGDAQRVSRRLFRLADVAGITDARQRPWGERHKLYLEAVGLGFGDSFEAGELSRELDSIERWKAEAADRAAKREAPKPEPVGTLRINVTGGCDVTGLRAGTEIVGRRAATVRPGMNVAVDRAEWDSVETGRVVAVTPEGVTVLEDGGPKVYDPAEVTFYHLDFDTLRAADNLTPAERVRLAELRARLEKLDRDDITNSTAALRLEREIYDLEHRSSADEWPEYIGEKGGRG